MLEGAWQVSRAISNTAEGVGRATFTLIDNNNLLYSEELEIKTFLNDQNIIGKKQYIYSYNNGLIEKYFVSSEGGSKAGLFYALEFLSASKAMGFHLCAEDEYRATYNFHDSNNFDLTYNV